MAPSSRASVDKIVIRMRASQANVSYADLHKVCKHYFGIPRQRGSSHAFFTVPWQGLPRVNIQSDRGKAKEYQVRQVLAAIEIVERTAGG